MVIWLYGYMVIWLYGYMVMVMVIVIKTCKLNDIFYCYLQATIRRAIFFMFVYVSNVQILTGKR
jgi:hypothetical protein